MRSSSTYYTVTLRSGVRFVASLQFDEADVAGLLHFKPLFLPDRSLLIPTTSVEAMAVCTEKEATRTAKTLNGKSEFHRLFGEVALRLQIP